MTPGPADSQPPPKDPPVVLAVGNQKGGVGKTTVTMGLGEAALSAGLNVVLVDFDPQANLTTVLHPNPELVATGDMPSIENVLTRGARPITDVLTQSVWPGVRIAPATTTLSGIEGYLITEEHAANASGNWTSAPRLRLRQALRTLDADLVVIDLNRTLSVAATMGLLAADGVIGVAEPSTFSDRGLADLQVTVGSLGAFLHGDEEPPELIGIILNQMTRTREAERVLAGLTARWGERLWSPPIPARAAVKEAYSGYREQLRNFGTAASEVAAIFDTHLATALNCIAERRTQTKTKES